MNLNYGKSDAEAFYNSITENSNLYQNINSKILINKDASKENILNSLIEFQKNIRENDQFILYYAGHGKTIINPNNDETFYFLPTEVSSLSDTRIISNKGISSDDIVRIMRSIKTSKQLLIIDACESGSVANSFIKFNQEVGGHILFASGSKQLAKEFGALGHGIFTYSLLESLKKYDTLNISMLSGEMDLILENLRDKLKLYDQSFGYYRTQESPNFFIKDYK